MFYFRSLIPSLCTVVLNMHNKDVIMQYSDNFRSLLSALCSIICQNEWKLVRRSCYCCSLHLLVRLHVLMGWFWSFFPVWWTCKHMIIRNNCCCRINFIVRMALVSVGLLKWVYQNFFSLIDSVVLFPLRHFWKSALLIASYFRSANVSDRYYCSLFLPLQFRVIRESGEGPVGGLILEDICTCQGCGTAGAQIIQQAHRGAVADCYHPCSVCAAMPVHRHWYTARNDYVEGELCILCVCVWVFVRCGLGLVTVFKTSSPSFLSLSLSFSLLSLISL